MTTENASGTPVVLDIGTDTTKAGFAGDKTPRALVRTIFGKYRDTGAELFGNNVLPVIDEVQLHYPISNGCILVENLKDFSRFVQHLYDDILKVNPQDHPVLFLISGKGLGDWQGVAWRFFKKVGVPSLKIIRSCMGGIHATGLPTAFLMQVGAGNCVAAPFFNYYGTQRTVGRYYIGARKDVDVMLHRQLVARGKLPDTPSGLEEARRVKEQVCYTALDFEAEKRKAEAHENVATATLSNGTEIECDMERILGPEVFFAPGLNSLLIDGRPMATLCEAPLNGTFYQSMHADFSRTVEEWRVELLKHVFLMGGHARMPGFKERVARELALVHPGHEISVLVPEHAGVLEWTGGSMLAAKGKIDWVTRRAWDDAGRSYHKAANPGWSEGDYY